MILTLMAMSCLFASVAGAELQPRTVESPSGRWSLRIAPETRSGAGAALYSMSEESEERWKRIHPFALWEARVTDGGQVAGYAYVGGKSEGLRGTLSVILLSSEGEVLLHEPHQRTHSRFHHMPSDPRPLGLFVQPELERFVVRIADEDINRMAESWWAYELGKGTPLFKRRPKLDLAPDLDRAVRQALDARPVPGTPLVLVHWYRFETSRKPWERGGLFQLLDVEGEVAWELALPNDYEVPGDEAAEGALQKELWENGGVLSTGDGTFGLWHAASGEHVSYAVALAPGGEEWSVTETGRTLRESSEEQPLPTLKPKLLRVVSLGKVPSRQPDIRDILAFAFDGRSRIRFARRESAGTSLVRLDGAGVVLRDVHIAHEDLGVEEVEWFPIDAPLWVAVEEHYRSEPRVRAWVVNEETGEARELPALDWQFSSRVVPLHGAGFVVSSPLRAHDLDGGLLWSGEKNRFCVDDVATTDTGEVVVLDVVRRTLHVLGRDGEYDHAIDLERAWGQKPNYPAGIEPAPGGGVLVRDFRGSPPLWRMKLDGEVVQRFDARTSEGVGHEDYRRFARFAPDGRLWTTDQHVFVRLDDGGQAVERLGPPLAVDRLQSVALCTVDSTAGRVVLQDQRSRAFHIFGPDGERLGLCVPSPESFPKLRYPMEIHCESSGALWVAENWYTRSYQHFGANGVDLGGKKLAASNVAFVGDGDGYWGMRKKALVRVLADGTVAFELKKNAEGRWWRAVEDIAAAPDGSVVVFDAEESDGLSTTMGAPLVTLIDGEGRPGRCFELPEDLYITRIAFAPPWVLVHAWSAEAWVLDVRDGSLLSLDFGAEIDSTRSFSCGLLPGGDEVWLVDSEERRLLRYELKP